MGRITVVSFATALIAPLFITTGDAQVAKDPDIVRISQDSEGLNEFEWTVNPQDPYRHFSLSSNGSVIVYSSVVWGEQYGGPAVSYARLRNTEGAKKLEIACRGKLPQGNPGNPGYPLFNPVVSSNGQLIASGFGTFNSELDRYEDYVEVHTLNDKCEAKLIFRSSVKNTSRSVTGLALSSDGRFLAYSFKEPEADNTDPEEGGWSYNRGTASIKVVDLGKVSPTGQVDPSTESLVWSEEYDYQGDLRVIGAVSIPGAPAKVIVGRSSWQSDISVDGAHSQVFLLTSKGSGVQGDLKLLVREVRNGYSDFSMNDSGTLSAFTASTLFSEKNLPKAFASYDIHDSNRAMDVFAKNHGKSSDVIRVSKPGGCSDSDVACQPNFQSGHAYMSATGKYIAFMTRSDNLLKRDINYSSDILIYNLETGRLTAPVRVNNGKQPDNDCRYPAVSSDGKILAFVSYARNLAKLPDYEKHTDDPVADLYVAKVKE